MGLMEPGFFHSNFFANHYWHYNYWLIYDQVIEGSVRGNITYSSGNDGTISYSDNEGTITYTDGNSGVISYT